MIDEQTEELILKFIFRTASDDEIRELTELIERNPQAAVALEKHLRAKALIDSKGQDEEEAISAFKKVLFRKRVQLFFRDSRRVAALLAGLIVSATALMLTWSYIRHYSFSGETETAIYTTRIGEIKRLLLSDGTKVCLAPDSRISFPKRFDTQKRDVQLYGEAYFEVTHDTKRPFEVRTRHSKVRVLGTRFNIHAYPNESYEQTALLEGKVKINLYTRGRPSGEEILKPNTNVRIDTTTGTYTIASTTPNEILAWQQKRLVFNNERFVDIAKKLERFYNISIKFSTPALTDIRFTAEFDKESVEEILKSFQIIDSFSYTRKGNTYYLSH